MSDAFWNEKQEVRSKCCVCGRPVKNKLLHIRIQAPTCRQCHVPARYSAFYMGPRKTREETLPIPFEDLELD